MKISLVRERRRKSDWWWRKGSCHIVFNSSRQLPNQHAGSGHCDLSQQTGWEHGRELSRLLVGGGVFRTLDKQPSGTRVYQLHCSRDDVVK